MLPSQKAIFTGLVSSKPLPRFKFLMSHCHLLSDARRSEEKRKDQMILQSREEDRPAKGLERPEHYSRTLFPESEANDNHGGPLLRPPATWLFPPKSRVK